jgi:hypothetical protein
MRGFPPLPLKKILPLPIFRVVLLRKVTDTKSPVVKGAGVQKTVKKSAAITLRYGVGESSSEK